MQRLRQHFEQNEGEGARSGDGQAGEGGGEGAGEGGGEVAGQAASAAAALQVALVFACGCGYEANETERYGCRLINGGDPLLVLASEDNWSKLGKLCIGNGLP